MSDFSEDLRRSTADYLEFVDLLESEYGEGSVLELIVSAEDPELLYRWRPGPPALATELADADCESIPE